MGMKANQFELQKIVCKTNAKDVDPVYRLPSDDWFFENKMSAIKTTACKSFCSSHKAAIKKKSTLKKKQDVSDCVIEGSIGIQKQYVRFLSDKDQCRGPRSTQSVIMKGSLGGPMRISKRVDRIPPFEHDFKIVKRPNGKFIMQIPSDPLWTRRNASNDQLQKRICGIDPGGRTFATIYDPIEKIAYQVGTEEDKGFDLRPIHNKIDETHWHLSNAQKRNQTRVAEERQRQLKKLHLKLKTFVSHIHLTLSSHLVKHFELVSLGKISISSIVKKEVGKRSIPRRAKRDLLCWQHYKFRERLLHRSVGTDCEIIVQNEAYTSKTCGNCGVRNKTLGASETFICDSCNFETHRDINGARNILLKSLKMFPFAGKL